jgi:N-acetylgalactosamine kinase
MLTMQAADMLGVQQQQLLQVLPQSLQEAAAAATQLHLQQRACHVFSEAQRVLTFKQICEDTQLPAPLKLQQLGELLHASHTSCSQLYQCSCAELDTLVGVARTAGALGARLTGGGATDCC